MESGMLSLKWENHKVTFSELLSTIRKKRQYCDATIACEGRFYKVHKMVMSACSDYLEHMFEESNLNNSGVATHPVIVLQDIRYKHLEALLDYMYIGEVNVMQSELPSLIKAADCLRVKGLAVPDDRAVEKNDSYYKNRTNYFDQKVKDENYDDDHSVQSKESSQLLENRSKRQHDGINKESSLNAKKRHCFEEQYNEGNVNESKTDGSLPSSNDSRNDQSIDKATYFPDGKYQNVDQSEANHTRVSSENTSSQSVSVIEYSIKEEPIDMDSSERYSSVENDVIDYSQDNFDQRNRQLNQMQNNATSEQDSYQESIRVNHSSQEKNLGPHFMTGYSPLQSKTFSNLSKQHIDMRIIDEYIPRSGHESHNVSEEYVDMRLSDGFQAGGSDLFQDGNEIWQQSNRGPGTGVSCPFCTKVYHNKSAFMYHYKGHTGEKPFACSNCPQRFTQKSDLDRHFKIHTGEKPFACPHCPRFFNQKCNMKDHINRRHPETMATQLVPC